MNETEHKQMMECIEKHGGGFKNEDTGLWEPIENFGAYHKECIRKDAACRQNFNDVFNVETKTEDGLQWENVVGRTIWKSLDEQILRKRMEETLTEDDDFCAPIKPKVETKKLTYTL